MSWAVEEWKDGLPGKALQKIQEIESQLDKLKKERQQKQFQMDSLEAALQKQKQKVDVEKNEAAVLKRENQSLVESCENLEKNRQKVAHELQVKELQVNYLEGQLNSSKKQIEKLEQEIKRNKNDLDRSQPSHASDLQSYSTPQKAFATPVPPSYKHHDSKFEDLQEKYNREVEERKRLDTELKVLQVKLMNQSSMSHKDIARQQTQSSIFPWQQEQKSSCQPPYTETPLKRKTGTSSFLWESEETPLKQNPRSTPALQCESATSQPSEQLRAVNQDLKAKVSELELRLQAQEKDVKNQINKFQEVQSQLDKVKKDLNEKDKALSKSRDELTKVSGQYEQTVNKCSLVEQKLKQVTEEMNCQRHNAEISRQALEQKMKDQEKENQKELARQQNSQLALEQQVNQMKTKLTQELQQAKKDHNMLQSDYDKVCEQKNQQEKVLEDLKQKLCRSEQGLQASQAKEMDFKKKSEEMQKEKNGLSSQLEQGAKRLAQVEEELKTAQQALKYSHNMGEDLKAKNEVLTEELKSQKSIAQDLENLKKKLAEVETEKEAYVNKLQKQTVEREQMTSKTIALERENQKLQLTFNSKCNECAELKKETESLFKWKDEKENLINNAETERETMLNRIGELEKSMDGLNDVHCKLNEKLSNLENEKGCLMGQVDSLKGDLLNKCIELEEKEKVYSELLKRSEEADQKYSKDSENTMVQITALLGQVTGLESRLKQETSRLETMEKSQNELLAQYENACDLAKSKDSVIELNQSEISHLRDSLSSTLAQQEQQLANYDEEKCRLMKEYEESLSEKSVEVEQTKLNLEKSQQDVPLLNDQIASLESSLKLQKSLCIELRSRYDDLSKVRDELQERMTEAEKNEHKILCEMNILSEQAASAVSLQTQCNSLEAAADEHKTALQNISEILNQKVNEYSTLSAISEELKSQLKGSEDKASILETENLQMSETLKLMEKDNEELSGRNQCLQEAYDLLCEEKIALLKEKEATLEVSLGLKRQVEASSQSCAALKDLLEDLQSKHTFAVELNSTLECRLNDHLNQITSQEKEIKELEEKYKNESARHTSEIEEYSEKQRGLIEELDAIKAQFENNSNNVSEVKKKLLCAEAEVSQLKMDVACACDKLVKADDAYKMICQENECCKQTVSLNCKEIETLKAALSSSGNVIHEKEYTIQSLEKRLNDAESEKVKAYDALKEKDVDMNKIKVQLEMLQMDLEDNDVCINSFDSQIHTLQSNIHILESKLQESELQRYALQGELCSLRNELVLKDELLQTKASSEDAKKYQQNSTGLAIEMESLQAECSKNTLEVEHGQNANLEKIYNESTVRNSKLDEKLKDWENYNLTEDEKDGFKQENGVLQSQREESFITAIESSTDNNLTSMKKGVPGNKQLEMNLSLSLLQNDIVLDEQEVDLHFQELEQQSLSEQQQQQTSQSLMINSECEEACPSVITSLCNEEDPQRLEPSCDIQPELFDTPDVTGVGSLEACVALLEGKREQTLSQSHSGSISAFFLGEERGEEDLQALSSALEVAVRSLEDKMETQKGVSKMEMGKLKEFLCRLREDLEQLQKQHFSEVQSWQQKLVNLNLEMEAKLAAERQHSVILSSELEAARLHMQSLDLGSHSLPCADADNKCLLQPHAEVHATPQKTQREDEAGELKECTVLGTSSLQCEFTAGMDQIIASDPTVGKNVIVATIHKNLDQKQLLEELGKKMETVQTLQEELQTLRLQLELCTAEMTSKKELCTEMENKVHKTEDEKSEYLYKLNANIQEKQRMCDQIEKLEEEVCTLTLELQTSKSQLSDVMEMLESLEIAKGGWDDKFFQMESDLKRVQSEKANLEKHILSMEADMEKMHEEKQKLEEEFDSSRKVNAKLEELLNRETSEGVQLKQDLLSCNDEKEKTDQTLLMWVEKAKQLEKNNNDSRELMKILEEDIRDQRRQRETASGNIENLQKEKQQLMQQLEVLEQTIALINEEKENLLKDLDQFKEEERALATSSEATVCKIQTLEDEKSRLSQSLEFSLLEKGEIASRLNSTQEEVNQLKAGIEKLRVRIEADEKKKHKMSELLKAAQRKADNLQDSVEKLEREKEITEQSLEDAIIQAETAQADLDELKSENSELAKRIEQLMLEHNNLKDEMKRLENDLVQKIEQNESLQKEIKEAEIKWETLTEELQSKVSTVGSELQACQNELESALQKKLDLTSRVSSGEMEIELLSQRLQESQKLLTDMQSINHTMSEDLAVKQHELKESREEGEKLKPQMAELQALRDQLTVLAAERKALDEENSRLRSAAEDWEQKAQMESSRSEVMHSTITSLEGEARQQEIYLRAAEQMNAELNRKMDALLESNVELQSQIGESLSGTEAAQETFNKERTSLISELQSFQQQAESLKISLEILVSEKAELTRNLECTKENLADEVKERLMIHQEMLKQIEQRDVELNTLREELTAAEGRALDYTTEISSLKSSKEELNSALRLAESKLEKLDKIQIEELSSRIACISKEKDSVLGKMNLWMKTCKQLENEKETLLEENEQQRVLIATLQNGQKQGDSDCTEEDLQVQIQELKEALEEKTTEADESVDKYYSLLVNLHKLEESNETLQNRVAQLTSQVASSKGRRSMTKVPLKAPSPTQAENKEVKEGGQCQVSGKRQWSAITEVNNTPIKVQESLHSIAKKIRACATPQAARSLDAQNEEEFRPEGLPELVQKGFADIPCGESSPFIMRRTTVPRCSPRLAAKRSPISQHTQRTPNTIVKSSPKPTAEGSKPQTILGARSIQTPAGGTSGTLSCVTNSPKIQDLEQPVGNIEGRKGRQSLSKKQIPEHREKLQQNMTSRQQDENCHVQ